MFKFQVTFNDGKTAGQTITVESPIRSTSSVKSMVAQRLGIPYRNIQIQRLES